MTDVTLLTVILNYKTAKMTLDATDAALNAMTDVTGEIIIVDNDSQDGSFEMIAAHIAEEGWNQNHRVRIVQSGRNGGFGAGNNVGIRTGMSDGSKPDLVYVLNSDAFPATDAIRALMSHLHAHPKTAFAGSYIHGEDGERHVTVFRFPSLASEFEGAIRFGPVSRVFKNSRIPMEDVHSTQTVDWLAGASLMMRQSVLDEIGLFDETFFLYFEETDLCRRVSRAGYIIDFVKESSVKHIGSVSTGMRNWTRVPDYWFESRRYYFVKNHGAAYAMAATLLHLIGGGLHKLRCLLTRRDHGYAPAFLRTLARHEVAAVFKPRTNQINIAVSKPEGK